MMRIRSASRRRRAAAIAFLNAVVFVLCATGTGSAHPLGNFTINHFARLTVDADRVSIRYVVDMAEVSTFQELQTADTNGDGEPSSAELDAYLERVAPQYANGIILTIDGSRVPLKIVDRKVSLPPGTGGLPTLRVECDYTGELDAGSGTATREVRFEDTNHQGRIGWHEIVVAPRSGISIFNSDAFGNGMTDELKAYPQDMLAAPLDERIAELSFTKGTNIPAGATALMTRDGLPATPLSRDMFAELIAVPEVTPLVALLGLLMAAALGAFHALSPGHGKAVVGAYLVGSRGTPRHAAFLGLTVTITHTIGVFALGLVTLFASQYILPERLFPILGFISGGIVLVIGLSLFIRRLRAALRHSTHEHPHHAHTDAHAHDHTHAHHDHGGEQSLTHSHGGKAHSHLPPGADGSPVTWRSLLALGISGGLLPCPSALVVMLSAISLHRVGYGLMLVVAFSIGLAITLTSIGLAFVYAGSLMKRPLGAGRLVRVLPVMSAFVISCVGAAICYEALAQAGLSLTSLFARAPTPANSVTTASVLALGLVFGLKHAVEADHLAAVTTIVSERKSLLGSSLVGGLWGVGHTISLFVVGCAVILLHIEIAERTALILEFGVALMLIALGANAVRKLLRGGHLHLHWHRHGAHAHAHPHIHDDDALEPEPHTHHGYGLGARPLVVGMIHGLAGSAALMLLVLSTIPSPLVGLVYIAVFGLGSIGGMMAMSALVGLPVRLTANRFARANLVLRGLAGIFSLSFGLFMVYEIGFVDGLFR